MFEFRRGGQVPQKFKSQERKIIANMKTEINQESVFQQILKVDDPEKSGEDKYSQSRIYLMISFLVMIGILLSQVFYDVSSLATVLEYLLYLVLIFSGYAISGKGISAFMKIKK